MLKQERRRAAEAEATLKDAGVEPKRAPSPIMGSTSPLPPPPKTSGASPAGPPSSREMGSLADSDQSVRGSRGLTFLQKGGASSGKESEGQSVHGRLSEDFVKMRAALKTGWFYVFKRCIYINVPSLRVRVLDKLCIT